MSSVCLVGKVDLLLVAAISVVCLASGAEAAACCLPCIKTIIK